MNQQNYLKSITIIALTACAAGIAWWGWSLRNEYQQTQQLRKANDLLEKKEYNLAIAAYNSMSTADLETNYSIWINKGYAFLGLDRYQDMLKSCSTATSIEPRAALAWNCRGEALYYLKQEREALQAFERAIEENPQIATFWLNKARVFADLQSDNKAIAANDRAIELTNLSSKSERAIAFNQKGQSLLRTKQYRKSLAAFKQSLKYFPDYLSAQQGKGIALYELENFDQAIAVFQLILQRDNLTQEQEAISLLYTGVSLCQTQKIGAAKEAFKEVLALTTNVSLQEIAQKGCGIQ